MTNHLSISQAWVETKARLAEDGRLFASVALALVALPTAVAELASPGVASDVAPSMGGGLLVFIASMIAIVGQLALIRLAIGPSITVGGAIRHGLARAPIYIAALILLMLAIACLAVPFIIVLAAMGVSFEPGAAVPPSAYIVLVAAILLMLAVAVRMLMSSPVASAEGVGPVRILTRSWQLTRGNWLRLLGFLILIVLAVGIAFGAINLAAETVVRLLFDSVEPWSVGALIIALVSAVLNAIASTVFVVMIARMYVQLAGRGGAEVSVPSTGT